MLCLNIAGVVPVVEPNNKLAQSCTILLQILPCPEMFSQTKIATDKMKLIKQLREGNPLPKCMVRAHHEAGAGLHEPALPREHSQLTRSVLTQLLFEWWWERGTIELVTDGWLF